MIAGKKYYFFLIFYLLVSLQINAQQNSDEAYKRPLKEVLEQIEKRYGVKIKYVDSLVQGKWVNYANWRFRQDVETTLDNVLKPLDLKVKKEKDKQYKLSVYEYYRWNVEDGWAEMDRIASQYASKTSWEKRKDSLKPALLKALQLSPLPASPGTAVIITAKRIFNGYSVENIAIEILPGVYINGSLYKPLQYKGRIPVILNPDGHWEKQRYRPDCQYRCAAMAKMGAMAFSYDLFAWGESTLQFAFENHRKSLSMTIQALGSIRILDYLLSLKDTDSSRVAMTGGSGAGSHTVLMTAIDDRIKASAPVVSLSSYFYGGCPCESGMPIHACGSGTNNVEIAAMAAPRPQLVVSDGGDWTDKMPEHDFPYLQKVYDWYGAKALISNTHLPNDKHDFGLSKRIPVYQFMAQTLGLNLKAIQNVNGQIDESGITIEKETALYVFGEKGEQLPKNALKGFDNLERLFYSYFK
ncbi:MAG TPA: acetylxylan esterase [Sediminibacterium sp.]|jgi:dienelactone hydrolase|nr:acetylxylan esterase [Sediminibacterium sp.]HQS54361.1 acetylxylan esterase [Sediminibacterium sp.]